LMVSFCRRGHAVWFGLAVSTAAAGASLYVKKNASVSVILVYCNAPIEKLCEKCALRGFLFNLLMMRTVKVWKIGFFRAKILDC
jgi:hypothetical protein